MLSQRPLVLSSKILERLFLQRMCLSTYSDPQSINTVPNTILLKTGKFTDRANTFINFLPSGYQYVIERFGKFNRIAQPGLNISELWKSWEHKIKAHSSCHIIWETLHLHWNHANRFLIKDINHSYK